MAGAGTCLEASGGASDVCSASSQNFCCTLEGGRMATYTERVFPAGAGRFCVNPANFFNCQATKCVAKSAQC
jgi:hypothetical protein